MKVLTTILLLFSLAAFGQGRDLTITNTVKGYKAVTDTDFKRWSDSVAKATKAEALKVVQENISKATADAKAAAAKSFADYMKGFSTVEPFRENLSPVDSTGIGKVFLLSFVPAPATFERVVGISDTMNMELVPDVDYIMTKTTGRITLKGKGLQLFARKQIQVVYEKISL